MSIADLIIRHRLLQMAHSDLQPQSPAPQPPSGLLPVGGPRPALLSPDLAQAPPPADLGGVVSGSLGTALANPQPANPGWFLTGLGAQLLHDAASGAPLDLGTAVLQGRARAHLSANMMQAQKVQHALDQHYPDGNVPLHVLQTIHQHAMAAGNDLLANGIAQEMSYRIAVAKLAAANQTHLQRDIVYNQAGEASSSVFDPSTGVSLTVPLYESVGDGKVQRVSRGPATASVNIQKLGWHNADETGISGLDPSKQYYGGFLNTANGPRFVRVAQPAQAPATGQAAAAGYAPGERAVPPKAPSDATSQFTDALATIKLNEGQLNQPASDGEPLWTKLYGRKAWLYSHQTAQDAAVLTGADAAGYGDWKKAHDAEDEIANTYPSLLKGRINSYRIELTRSSMLIDEHDTAASAATKWHRFERIRQVQEMIYSGGMTAPEARKAIANALPSGLDDVADALVKVFEEGKSGGAGSGQSGQGSGTDIKSKTDKAFGGAS